MSKILTPSEVVTLQKRIESARLVLEGGVAFEGTEAAIFKNDQGCFGVVETQAPEGFGVFETAEMSAADVSRICFDIQHRRGSARTKYLAVQIIPDYEF